LLNDGEAIDPLIEALEDKDIYVRDRVAKALAQITGQDLGVASKKWKEWREKNK